MERLARNPAIEKVVAMVLAQQMFGGNISRTDAWEPQRPEVKQSLRAKARWILENIDDVREFGPLLEGEEWIDHR
jgi:hypothetical protein